MNGKNTMTKKCICIIAGALFCVMYPEKAVGERFDRCWTKKQKNDGGI